LSHYAAYFEKGISDLSSLTYKGIIVDIVGGFFLKKKVHVETTSSDNKALWQIGVVTCNMHMMITE
jgi:hypothetical protein